MRYYICENCGAKDEAPEDEDFVEIETMYGMCESCYKDFCKNNAIMKAYDEKYRACGSIR